MTKDDLNINACKACGGTGQVPIQFSMMLDGICDECSGTGINPTVAELLDSLKVAYSCSIIGIGCGGNMDSLSKELEQEEN